MAAIAVVALVVTAVAVVIPRHGNSTGSSNDDSGREDASADTGTATHAGPLSVDAAWSEPACSNCELFQLRLRGYSDGWRVKFSGIVRETGAEVYAPDCLVDGRVQNFGGIHDCIDVPDGKPFFVRFEYAPNGLESLTMTLTNYNSYRTLPDVTINVAAPTTSPPLLLLKVGGRSSLDSGNQHQYLQVFYSTPDLAFGDVGLTLNDIQLSRASTESATTYSTSPQSAATWNDVTKITLPRTAREGQTLVVQVNGHEAQRFAV